MAVGEPLLSSKDAPRPQEPFSDIVVGRGSAEHPILLQVGLLGKGYQDWVHRPVGGRPRFFSNPYLENITRTPWWVVPALWTPVFSALLAVSLRGDAVSLLASLAYFCLGVLGWQVIEYAVHRWVFHLKWESYWGITFHFLMHGCHHKFPTDCLRLVFPPVPAFCVGLAIYSGLRIVAPQEAVLPLFSGIGLAYVVYDCLHYGMHYSKIQGWLSPLRRAHLGHHFTSQDSVYGITSPLVDVVFGTWK